MTNPSNIVRTRARISGRASVYEANSWCQPFSVGLLDGNGVLENTSPNMNVLVGGTSSTKPDTVIASTPSGYKIALDIVGQQAVAITAPASNSRITCIVAYTNDLSVASTDTTVTGNPSSCGLIVVNGTSSASPVAPDDTAIRSAITTDGATGSQAVYCIIAKMTIASTTTAITNSLITITNSTLLSSRIAASSIALAKINGGATAGVIQTDTSGNVTPVTFTQATGNFRFGTTRVAWGSLVTGSIGTPAGSETSGSITFGVTFASAPVVTLTVSDFPGGVAEYISYSSTTTTGCTYFAGHALASGSASTMTVNWLAIGAA